MKIRQAGLSDKDAWDSYVNNCPDASPYCLFSWKEAIENSYGHKPCYLLAEEDQQITGIFPLFHFHFPLHSGSLVSLPFCDVGDILADSPETCRQLLQAGRELAQSLRVRRLEIRSRQQNLADYADPGWYTEVQTSKVSMLLKLPSTSEDLWKQFKSKLRSQVRKAEKNELVFRWGTLEDLDDFYHVFSRNMHSLGSPVHSRQWIAEVVRCYDNNARMGLVYKDDIPIGCGIILFTRQQVAIPWASTLRQYNRLAPTMLLYWNFLKFAADHEFTIFDFGRSTPNEGTYKFKKQWGAEPHPLYWYSLSSKKEPLSHGSAPASRDRAARIWQKLPLSLANSVGPLLRKYISL